MGIVGACKWNELSILRRLTLFSRPAPTPIGQLGTRSPFSVEQTQREAWEIQIQILQDVLRDAHGKIYSNMTSLGWVVA